MLFKLRGCLKCYGDLYLEDLDWKCLQCGRYYYSPRWESYPIPREMTRDKASTLPGLGAGFRKRRARNKSTRGSVAV